MYEPNKLVCDCCERVYDITNKRILCDCGCLLTIEIGDTDFNWSIVRGRPMGVWRYRELIPTPREAFIVSMGEGGTPLIEMVRLNSVLKLRGVKVKFEGSNPTGSFKDRGLTVASTMALFFKCRAMIVASTGNTASSMSAYARRAGLKPIVIIPSSGVARGKLGQLKLYGALIVEVSGGFDEAMKAVIEYSKIGSDIYIVNSINPWRIEGQKTIAYEIIEQHGVPDWVVVPVGNGGNIYSIWKGFKEILRLGLIDKIPRMLAVQALGSSPILRAYKSGVYEPFKEPRTIASAIRIGNPVHWRRVLRVIEESRGAVVGVDDSEIIRAHKEIARLEGLGLETSSSTTLAGLKKALEDKVVDRGENAILVATGHALKEPEIIDSYDLELIKVDSVNDLISILSKL
ncbi:MAG: threonine synthase [Acidilobaceae archaeon]